MASPPKPWEQRGGSAPLTPPAVDMPEIPVRLTQRNNQFNSTYGAGGAGYVGNSFGSSPYGGQGYGGYGGVNSGFGNRFGAGSYNSYGGMGYGSNQYGGNQFGANQYGNQFNQRMGMNRMGPEGDPSFTQQMEISTQSTFQVLDQIVQAFGGFSQMLESTFFATHSSFMAMIGVAEQFGQLRGYLGQVLSIMSLYNTTKDYIYRITGRSVPVDTTQITSGAFDDFSRPKPSKRPLFVFVAMIIGLPYLMSLLMRKIESSKQAPLDITQLEFCKSLYDFQTEHQSDLSFRKGDLIAILSKLEPDSDWWKGRTQDGRVGLFPKNRVVMISKKEPVKDTSPH